MTSPGSVIDLYSVIITQTLSIGNRSVRSAGACARKRSGTLKTKIPKY